MLITGREAACHLAEVVPTREHARLLLRTGLAGIGTRTSAALLYDRDAVLALAARPLVDESELERACPQGLYVARLARTTALDLTRGRERAVTQVARQPAMPSLTRALIAARLTHHRQLPWVATLFGFVVLCADATGMAATPGGRVAFTLKEPGAWVEVVAGRRFPTRRGRPWLMWTPPPQLQPHALRGLSARG